MNEETFFALTDELVMEAKEDQTRFIRLLEQQGYTMADLIAEAHTALDRTNVDWSRLFALAILGVKLDAHN
jgi:hypothetical protein